MPVGLLLVGQLIRHSKIRRWKKVGRMKWPLAFGFVAACLVWGCEQRDQPATNDDLRILLKAEELLKDESVWNRKDDRECDDDEATGKRSLFCALQKACLDVLGAYDHRRVALQEVRFAVEDATGDQDFEHRLRDFNNLPTTRLADIRKVLQVATDRVKSRLKGK